MANQNPTPNHFAPISTSSPHTSSPLPSPYSVYAPDSEPPTSPIGGREDSIGNTNDLDGLSDDDILGSLYVRPNSLSDNEGSQPITSEVAAEMYLEDLTTHFNSLADLFQHRVFDTLPLKSQGVLSGRTREIFKHYGQHGSLDRLRLGVEEFMKGGCTVKAEYKRVSAGKLELTKPGEGLKLWEGLDNMLRRGGIQDKTVRRTLLEDAADCEEVEGEWEEGYDEAVLQEIRNDSRIGREKGKAREDRKTFTNAASTATTATGTNSTLNDKTDSSPSRASSQITNTPLAPHTTPPSTPTTPNPRSLHQPSTLLVPHHRRSPFTPADITFRFPDQITLPESYVVLLNNTYALFNAYALSLLRHHTTKYGNEPVFRTGIHALIRSELEDIISSVDKGFGDVVLYPDPDPDSVSDENASATDDVDVDDFDVLYDVGRGMKLSVRSFLREVHARSHGVGGGANGGNGGGNGVLNPVELRYVANVAGVPEEVIEDVWMVLDRRRRDVTAMRAVIARREIERVRWERERERERGFRDGEGCGGVGGEYEGGVRSRSESGSGESGERKRLMARWGDMDLMDVD